MSQFRSRDRHYRDSRYGKDHHGKERRSPDYYSSEDESYDDSRRSRSSHDRGSRNADRRSRRERDRSRSREKDRDRSYGSKYSSDHNEDSEQYEQEADRERGHVSKREEAPNNTLMIRGLAPHITENDIIQKLSESGLQPKDIRLMRKKETGASRGFAFVEFTNLSEAVHWKDMTQSVVGFDQCQATLHYSIPKDAYSADKGLIQKYDWTCYKCGVNNFKRREQCFKCGTPREESAANETGDEISPTPTNCLLLRNLSPHTAEERILTMLGTITSLPIKSIRIPRDAVYGLSRGVCFVELHTTLEASQLFTLLSSLNPGFIVDDFPLTINYAKRNMPSAHQSACAVNAASVALAAAHWTNQSDNAQVVPKSQGIHASTELTPAVTEEDLATDNSHQEMQPKGTVTVNGVLYQKYPTPDVSKYQYDKSSGYYYDPSTCLYYDAKSHYYYNSATQTYLYWTSEFETYLPADTSMAAGAGSDGQTDKLKDKVKEKQDKVKIAKKIAKDMEKWAKTLNQKKEVSKSASYQLPPSSTVSAAPSSSGVNEDSTSAIFANEGSNDGPSEIVTEMSAETKDRKLTENADENSDDQAFESLRYSPSHIAASIIEAEEQRLTDWEKLLCLLCKRQFSSKEQLVKHQQISELHKSNLEVLKRSRLTDEQLTELERKEANYRDRAKERRQKYGLPETPEPNKFKEKFLDEEEPEMAASAYNTPINDNNIGNKMLKAMGWSEGQGLGRSNQGRANIIQVERRTGCAGLGIRSSHGSGESYKDAVRRAMQQRFKELSEKE